MLSDKLGVTVKCGYLSAIALVFSLSSVVFIEPAPFDILILLLMGIGFFGGYLQVPQHLRVPLVLLWLFLLQNFISMYVAEEVGQGIKFLFVTTYLLVFWFFLVGIIIHFQASAINSLFFGYVSAAILSSIIGFLTYLRLMPSSEMFMTAGRIQAFFKDPNVFGPFLIPIALYSILELEKPGTLRKGWWAAVCMLMSAAIFLSYSRAAWINYVVSLSVLFVLFFRHIKHLRDKVRKLTTILLVSVLFIALYVYLIDIAHVSDMFTERFRLQGYDQERFATQKMAFQSLMTRPFGIGPGQADVTFHLSTHSLYARVFSENGIFGGIVFIIFVGITYVRIVRLAFQKLAYDRIFIVCAASLTGILVNSFVVDTLHWRHFWILMAIPWGAYKQNFEQ